MEKLYTFLLFLSCTILQAQVTLTGTSYTQNFDGIGSGLPIGWSVRTGATASALGTAETFSTTHANWGNTTGSFRNTAASESPLTSASTTTAQSNATDRALGLRQTGSFADGVSVLPAFCFQINNTTGFENFTLEFKLQQVDPGTAGRTVTWIVDYGFGASPTSWTTITTSPSSLTTTMGTWGSTDVSVNFGSVLDNNSNNVWIRVRASGASSGANNRPHTAIDDFQLNYDVVPTACTAPATQATNINITNNTNTSATINWTSGSGDNRIVVMKEGSAITGVPTSGDSYTANATFGIGQTIATNEYVVYNGSGSSVIVTGLKCNTTYYVQVFEYLNTDVCYNEDNDTDNPIDFTTLAAEILVTPTSYGGINYIIDNGPSSSYTYSLKASNLSPASGNIAVTAPANFQVSTDNSTFSNSVNVAYTGGNLSSTNIYVRLNSALGIAEYSGNITHTYTANPSPSCNASQNMSILGKVIPVPLDLSCADAFIENFNSMSTTTGDALPASWRMHNSSSPTFVDGTRDLGVQASSGSPTGGNTYNWGSTASERAPGVMTSGSFASPSSLMGFYRNTNANDITEISVSYDVERYRRNSANASVQFFYSFNGSTWTAVTAGDVATTDLPTGTSVHGFNPPQLVVNKSAFTVNFSSPIQSGEGFYLRWNLNTTGSNSQGIGIDNVSVTPTFDISCSSPTSQSTDVVISDIAGSTATLAWTNGNGSHRMVVIKENASITGAPCNGQTFNANSSFGQGNQIAPGEYVVYSGSGNTVDISGLKCNTNYSIKVFEYNSPGFCYNTSDDTDNPASFSTLEAEISTSLSTISDLNYIAGSGPSTSQSYTLSAENLSPLNGNITVSAPTNFEVSIDDITFSNSINVPYISGNLTDTTIYVRLKGSLGFNLYSGNITHTYTANPSPSCNASVTVAVDGYVAPAPCSELFISEYIEGTGNNKGIEIYNPSNASITLTGNYSLRVYTNGSTSFSSFSLTGSIPSKGTHLVANGSASFSGSANQTSGVMNFTGNDVVALMKGSQFIDIIGTISEDPGTAWTNGSLSTSDQTLIRKPDVERGVFINPSGGFPTLGTEWISVGLDRFDFINVHSSNCDNNSVVVTQSLNNSAPYCVSASSGAPISVPFETYGGFDLGNTFTAQLSNSSGSFSSPINIGSLALSGTDVSGVINATIPSGTTAGTGYKIRVIASEPLGTLGAYISPNQITVAVGPVNVTAALAIPSGESSITLTWGNPVCYDEIMVVMCADDPVVTMPTGNGNNYNLEGSGSCIANSCEVVVYKSTGNTVTLSGLTQGTTYYFKIFTRVGNEWSSGVSLNETPDGATVIRAGDFAVVGYNSNNFACNGSDPGGTDYIYFVCFKDIKDGTVIDITDNGWSNCNANFFNNTEGFYRVTYSGATIPAGTIIEWRFQGNVFNSNLGTGWTASNLSSGNFNLNAGGDQMFFMQGGTWFNGTLNNHDATYTGGRYLFAFNTKTTWGAAPDCSTTNNRTQFSDIPEEVGCYAQLPSAGATDFFLYTGAVTATDKFTWLQRFLNNSNWMSYANCSDFNSAYSSTFSSGAISINNASATATWNGSADNNWFNCANWSTSLVPDASVNVTIPNTSNDPIINFANPFSDQFIDIAVTKDITIQNGATLTIERDKDVIEIYGNLVINSGGQLIADSGILRIFGDWTNNAGSTGFNSGKSSVVFKGETSQFLNNSSGSQSFWNLVVEKPEQVGLVQIVDIEIENILFFNCGGYIDANGQELVVNNPSPTAINGYESPNDNGNYENDRYIRGKLVRAIDSEADYVFPIGDVVSGLKYNPVVLSVTGGLSGTATATGQFIPGNAGDCNAFERFSCGGISQFLEYSGMTGQGVWRFTGDVFNYNITLHSNINNLNIRPNNDNPAAYTNTYRALKAPTGTTDWSASSITLGGDPCEVGGYFAIPGYGYSGFSDFAPGGGVNKSTPLPVELIEFSVIKLDEDMSYLFWETASELNNHYFKILHSNDGIVFEPIGKVYGNGTSNKGFKYDFIHKNPVAGVNYYKLKQVDFDGSFEYSDIRSLFFEKYKYFNISLLGTIDKYPQLKIVSTNNTIAELTLYSVEGKQMFSEKIEVPAGYSYHNINLDLLANSIYFLNYTDFLGNTESFKLLSK